MEERRRIASDFRARRLLQASCEAALAGRPELRERE